MCGHRCVTDTDVTPMFDLAEASKLLVRSGSLVRVPVSQSGCWEASMKQSWFFSVVLLFSAVALTGCELVADIFKAGVWVGVLLVLGVIAIVIWLASKANK